MAITCNPNLLYPRWNLWRYLSLRLVLLSCQGDRSNGEIAQQLRVTLQTVGKWRTRFARERLDGPLDEPRRGAPRTINDPVIKQVIAKTLHEKPRVATRWSSRTMAKASGLSHTAVVRI